MTPRPADDGSPADWLRRSLVEFATTVTSVVPGEFAGYARIFHAFQSPDGRPVSWGQVADWSGRRTHARMQFTAIATPTPEGGKGVPPWDVGGPEEGNLPEASLNALCDVLRGQTATPDRCWFLVWDGYGWLRTPTAQPPQLAAAPPVHLPFRDYHLITAALADAGSIGWSPTPSWFASQSPNLFWPDDRAWCVATEVDLHSTYVGGSTALVDAILADDRLEAWRCQLDDPITFDSDEVNRDEP